MREDELRSVIFDVQAFSVHDGPGCRTTVFFSGCPLRCEWCANPENFAGRRHLMYAERVCKWNSGCRACVGLCNQGGMRFDNQKGPVVDWDICNKCTTFECTQYCASNALKICGKEYTVAELMKILHRDFNNWGSEGGVTFSGGEPLLQYEFLLEVLKKCRNLQIHTAIETTAYFDTEKFLNIMRYIDFAFIDLKNMDDAAHIRGTGVSNDKILRNIATLKESGWTGRLVLRTPIIGGFNDSAENAQKVIDFMKEHDLFEINLLKFHRLGQSKWEQMGLEYAYANCGDVTMEHLEMLQGMYLDNEIICYVGDRTPF